MEDKNLPELHNPIINMMQNGMPMLPEIIQKAFPVAIPQMKYDQNAGGMIFGNFKRKRIEKASECERIIAENSLAVVKAKFETIHEVVTFSAKVSDTLKFYEHLQTMRTLEVQEKQADIYIKQAQAQVIGFEAKLSELDYQLRLKQLKTEIEGEKNE